MSFEAPGDRNAALKSFGLERRVLVGARPDLDRRREADDSVGVQRFVNPLHGVENRFHLSFDVGSVGVLFDLESGIDEDLASAPDLVAHRDADANRDDLDLRESFHAVNLSRFAQGRERGSRRGGNQ